MGWLLWPSAMIKGANMLSDGPPNTLLQEAKLLFLFMKFKGDTPAVSSKQHQISALWGGWVAGEGSTGEGGGWLSRWERLSENEGDEGDR
ncbi:hypothetical protein V6N13_147529 [Hibiscus sabdariffa]